MMNTHRYVAIAIAALLVLSPALSGMVQALESEEESDPLIETITGLELMPFYDYEEHGGWVENENRAIELVPREFTYPKYNPGFQYEIDDDGFLYKVYDEEYLAQAHTTPDRTDNVVLGDFEQFSVWQDPDDPDGLYTWETHGNYIEDFGEWKPYLVYDEDDFIQIKFSNIHMFSCNIFIN